MTSLTRCGCAAARCTPHEHTRNHPPRAACRERAPHCSSAGHSPAAGRPVIARLLLGKASAVGQLPWGCHSPAAGHKAAARAPAAAASAAERVAARGASAARRPAVPPVPLQIIPAAIGTRPPYSPSPWPKGPAAACGALLRPPCHPAQAPDPSPMPPYACSASRWRSIRPYHPTQPRINRSLFPVNQSLILRKIPNSMNPLWRMLQSRRYSRVPIRTIVAPLARRSDNRWTCPWDNSAFSTPSTASSTRCSKSVRMPRTGRQQYPAAPPAAAMLMSPLNVDIGKIAHLPEGNQAPPPAACRLCGSRAMLI